MKDFLTRVAERALGTAPRIDPQATSRYAPARLPLPETHSLRAEMPASPPTSPARQFDVEQESAQKVTTPSVAPVRDERINVPEQPRKFDQSPLLSGRTPSANEPQPKFFPERINRNSVVASVAHETEDHPTPVFSRHVPDVDHSSGELEASEIAAPTTDSFPDRPASSVENEREVQWRPPQSPLKIKPSGDKANEITEPVEASSPPPLEVVVENGPPAKVYRPREHEQPARAAVSPIVAPPAATSDRRPHDRPERREKTIQVKIGRVEVHAPPAPVTPVQPPAPPGPKLSLAEFLRQHNRRRDE